MSWWQKIAKVGGAAAQGYLGASKNGLGGYEQVGNDINKLVRRKRKNNLVGGGASAGEDPGGEVESTPSYWADDRHEDY